MDAFPNDPIDPNKEFITRKELIDIFESVIQWQDDTAYAMHGYTPLHFILDRLRKNNDNTA